MVGVGAIVGAGALAIERSIDAVLPDEPEPDNSTEIIVHEMRKLYVDELATIKNNSVHELAIIGEKVGNALLESVHESGAKSYERPALPNFLIAPPPPPPPPSNVLMYIGSAATLICIIALVHMLCNCVKAIHRKFAKENETPML